MQAGIRVDQYSVAAATVNYTLPVDARLASVPYKNNVRSRQSSEIHNAYILLKESACAEPRLGTWTSDM